MTKSQDSVFSEILGTIKSCLPLESEEFNLHEPLFCGREWEYVKECLDTGWVSSVGKYVDKFERMLEDYTGSRKAIAVVNGTAAMHVCLKLAGVEVGDEVMMPALTFIATANAVSYCGAVPHFIDSDFATMGLSPNKLDDRLREIARIESNQCVNRITGRRIKAVVPVHTFGHPVEIDSLIDICKKYSLTLIEDAAESLGSFYKNKHTGTFGLFGVLSFNGNKIVTTGGGGAILTNDEDLGKLAKHITTTAKLPHRWAFVHDRVAFNYRMPNINAAIGCAQIEQLPVFLGNKRNLAEKYKKAFDRNKYALFASEPSETRSNYWLNTIKLLEPYAKMRDHLLDFLHDHGVKARPPWQLMNMLQMYRDCPRDDLTNSELICASCVNIPSGAELAKNSQIAGE
ncbi:MAG: Aminotransferase, DegT/DnrJ/EryC1/StrS family [Candidatus Rifleibacterium amylolyticum]|nr:MAG: Aminotransferase, DegT/DnrJ/EryC1/StrS family [Candidatus Rifleibacterium amylolyticum]